MKQFGLAAFDELKDGKYNDVNKTILEKQSVELRDQLMVFQERLVEFAKKHNSELQASPEFRSKFMHMCSSIGIDPLSLFDRDKHLFTVNDFYYEVCLKVIEICRKTKDMNGGVISFQELEKVHFRKLNVGLDDLEKSIDMLKSLECFEIFQIRGKKFLRSVPNELTSDQTKILEICSILGYSSISLLKANLGWEAVRSKSALDEMVANGLLWIDYQGGAEALYWDPSWITRQL